MLKSTRLSCLAPSMFGMIRESEALTRAAFSHVIFTCSPKLSLLSIITPRHRIEGFDTTTQSPILTEAVLISRKRIQETATFRIGDCVVVSKPSIRYLDVMIDSRLSFGEHVKVTCEKAVRASASLSRIMPNIGGPRQDRRVLLSTAISSIMLYAVPTWSIALETMRRQRQLASVQRLSSLRIVCAYRTVSDDAICVIGSKLPVESAVEELCSLYEHRHLSKEDRKEHKKEIR